MTSLPNRILAGVLVAQLVLAAITWTTTADRTTVPARTLIVVDPDQVTRLHITGRVTGEGEPPEPVELTRQGDGWVISSLFGYPADTDNVQQALEPLEELVVRAPIATLASSHEQLDVAEDHFTRRVEVTTEAGTTTVFLGASAGRGANVRLGGEDDVYSVRGTSAWAVPEHANRYFDRDVFEVDLADVGSVTVTRPGQPPLEIVRGELGWLSPALPGDLLDPGRTEQTLRALLSLRMLDPAAAVEAPEHGLDQGVTVTWTGLDGASSAEDRVRIGNPVPDKPGHYYARWDGQPFVLSVREGAVQTALEFSLDELVLQ